MPLPIALNNLHTCPNSSGTYAIIPKGVAESPHFGDYAGGVRGVVVTHCSIFFETSPNNFPIGKPDSKAGLVNDIFFRLR